MEIKEIRARELNAERFIKGQEQLPRQTCPLTLYADWLIE